MTFELSIRHQSKTAKQTVGESKVPKRGIYHVFRNKSWGMKKDNPHPRSSLQTENASAQSPLHVLTQHFPSTIWKFGWGILI